MQGGQSRRASRGYKRSFLFGSAHVGVWRMLRVSRTRRACYGPCVHVWNMWTRGTHLFNTIRFGQSCRRAAHRTASRKSRRNQCVTAEPRRAGRESRSRRGRSRRAGAAVRGRDRSRARRTGRRWRSGRLDLRPGRTMKSPGPAVGTRCGGPKAPERLSAGSTGCCGCSWSEAHRRRWRPRLGASFERSASPDRMNARFGRAPHYSTIRATRGRSRPTPAARGYEPMRPSVRSGGRVRHRSAGLPGVRHRCRTTHRESTALSDSGRSEQTA